jgi:hypothetical protein
MVLQGILHADQSLAGLRAESTAGRLRDFAIWELEHLVRALFKDSPMRRMTFEHFRANVPSTTSSSSTTTSTTSGGEPSTK